MKYRKVLIMILLALMCFSAVAESIPEATISQEELSSKAVVKEVQQHLIDLGYLHDVADGKFGKKSAAALGAFQAGAGLPATGKLDPVTYGRLKQAAESVRSPREVQQKLIDLGYLGGEADGKFGKQSAAALALFQRINRLEATGTLNEATLERLFAGEAIALPIGLNSKDSGEAVEALQQRLYDLGFLADMPDGDYGKSTQAAVKSFQQHLNTQGFGDDYGIRASGEATSVTRYFLESQIYSSYINDVVLGVQDSEALRVERRLVQLGYMDKPADDTLDDYALEALNLFKQKVDLPLEGDADRVTIDALFAMDAPYADHCAPHAIAFGDTGLAVRDVESALLAGGMTANLPVGSYNKNLKSAIERLYKYLKARKSEHAPLFSDAQTLSIEAQQKLQDGILGYVADVGKKKNTTEATRVQRRLYALYYLPKSGIDGLTGKESRDAIKAFQQENGLEQTGIADEATQRILFSNEAEYKRYRYRVEVSIARQKVYVYQLNADNGYDLVKTFNCSTGLHNSTPRGIFLNARPINRWHYFEKFHCWAQYSFRIEGDILFHSVIYGSKNENSLHRSSLRKLGDPASHGCVRLTVEDSKWLFENCERGSLVVVIY
ncbi:MAG: peptidoglycan-binding protein [Clostridia bacterium]|nr:peptidoglycan-binding protein [Clostridia bacterium]